MQTVSLYDSIIIEPAEALELITDLTIPIKENLVYKAADIFFAHDRFKAANTRNNSARITLKKEIPEQAGLGGGSSDAAYTLIGLNRLFGCIFTIEDLTEMASAIGSDVPFFICGSFAVVSGRGEMVIAHKVNSEINILLVKPPFPISTAWGYGQFAGRGFSAVSDRDALRDGLISALESSDFKHIARVMKNDIEDVLKDKFPLIGEIEDALLKEGAAAAMLSGSGSAVFGVFKDAMTRDDAALTIAKNYPDCLIRKAATKASAGHLTQNRDT